MSNKLQLKDARACPLQYVLAVNDTLNVLSGKWKLPILASLFFEKKKFSDIQRNIPKITPRMLSKELKDLEANGMVKRTVYDTTPVSVVYELTPSGKTIRVVLDHMVEWGVKHRNTTLKKVK